VSKVERLLGRRMASFEEGLRTMREQESRR
jgi:hypothetical protein